MRQTDEGTIEPRPVGSAHGIHGIVQNVLLRLDSVEAQRFLKNWRRTAVVEYTPAPIRITVR